MTVEKVVSIPGERDSPTIEHPPTEIVLPVDAVVTEDSQKLSAPSPDATVTEHNSIVADNNPMLQVTGITETSPPPDPPLQKEPMKDENLLSSNVSSVDLYPGDVLYHIKWIQFQGKSRPVVTQNENGPCPMIAISNVLSMRGTLQLPEGCEVVTGPRLVAILSDLLLAEIPNDLDEGQRWNYETQVSDALTLFPSLQTGLDVNIRFTGVADFEYTSALGVFDLFKIPLYHGWIVEPENEDLVSVIGDRTYNQLVEHVISLKSSGNEDSQHHGLLIEAFLDQTASQLTVHGLCELTSMVREDQLAVFFRNNHFNTIYKHKGRVYVLVTDHGLSQVDNIVWEALNDVDGDTQFVDASFRLYNVSSQSVTPLRNSPDSHNNAASLGNTNSSKVPEMEVEVRSVNANEDGGKSASSPDQKDIVAPTNNSPQQEQSSGQPSQLLTEFCANHCC